MKHNIQLNLLHKQQDADTPLNLSKYRTQADIS